MAQLARDKKALEERNKSLQGKNKSSAKKHRDEIEKLTKIKEDVDHQLVETMQQIRDLAAERDLYKKELDKLKAAAQAVVDMVDPPEEVTEQTKALLGRLLGALQGIIKYLSDTTRQYVSHVLGLVKSYWPQTNLVPLGEGISIECSEDKFAYLVEEVKPIADRIVDSLEQES